MLSEIREDAETQFNLFSIPGPICHDAQFFTIADSTTGTGVGFAQFYNFDPADQSAEIGVCIAPAYRRRGYGKAGMEALHEYAHKVFELQRIHLSVLETNTPAIELYKKAGYRQTGTKESMFEDIAAVLMERDLP